VSAESVTKAEIMAGLKREFPSWCIFPVLSGMVRMGKNYIKGAPKGTPDICGFLPDGRFLGIEAKSTTGRLRPEQYDFAVNATRAGAVVLVASSWEECKKKLEEALK
jgi:hypothetical protein